VRISNAAQPEPIVEHILVVAVLIATALVYVPTLAFPFAADDASQILGNPQVHSWSHIPEYFTTHVWGHVTLGPGRRAAAYYRPVFLLWELTTWLLFRTGTVGWHISAMALHMLTTALVYLLVRRITRDCMLATAAALLFGVHPVHVEAVAWVSGATEPLAAAPFLGAMLCWLRAHESPHSMWWRAASATLYGVALLAKETTIVLPVVLLTYELLRRRDRAGLVRRLMPYVVVALLYLLARRVVLRDTANTEISLDVLLMTWPSVIWFYVSRAVWPVHLSLLYDVSLVKQFSASDVLLPTLLAVVTGALVAWYARTNWVASFAVIWAVLLILPPLYLRAFAPGEFVHDRYLYLPSVGLCLLVALGLRQMQARAALVGVGVLAFLYSSLTVLESRPWSNEAALFSRAVAVAPHSWHARRQYAFALVRTGNCEDAMPVLAGIIDATPEDYEAVFGLGACDYHLGRVSEAEVMMRRTIALHPTYQQPYLLLALIQVRQHRLDEAEEQWRQSMAVQLGKNEERSFHLVHAEILKARGDLAGAIAEYRKELEVQPDNEEIEASLAVAEQAAAGRVPGRTRDGDAIPGRPVK
jgi:Flp pilus assembly protein TadD